MNVNVTLGACTGRARNPGIASAMKAGVVSSATRTSTIAPTIDLATIMEPASTLDRVPIRAPAQQDSLAPTASRKLTVAPISPARTAVLAEKVVPIIAANV